MLLSLGAVKTVVDVGANVGQFALLAHDCLPNASIHSFEPLPDAAETFVKVTPKDGRITLHRIALGGEVASLPIHVTSRADSSSLLTPALQSKIFPGTHEIGTHEVQVMPLDHVLSGQDLSAPALLKIDVQGYERQVLEGCASLLNCFDWIFVELSFIELYSGQALAPEVIAMLSESSFDLISVYSGNGAYRDGKMIQGDFLFERRKAKDIKI